jgi:rubrerythrin
MSTPTDFFSAVTALGAVEQLDLEAMRLLMRVERAGEDFYNGIADRIGDPDAAELLRRNGREERGHAERVRRVASLKLGQPFEPTAEDLAPLTVTLPDTIPADVLPVIVQGELDGDVGYQKWADRESDPEVQRLLRLNGREETQHGERVKQVIELLRAKA